MRGNGRRVYRIKSVTNGNYMLDDDDNGVGRCMT